MISWRCVAVEHTTSAEEELFRKSVYLGAHVQFGHSDHVLKLIIDVAVDNQRRLVTKLVWWPTEDDVSGGEGGLSVWLIRLLALNPSAYSGEVGGMLLGITGGSHSGLLMITGAATMNPAR